MFLLVPLFVTALVTVTTFYLWQWTFWRRRGMPGPIGVPILGNKLCLISHQTPSPLVLRDWTKKYGKTYGIQDGLMQTIVTSDPDVVQEVFQKQFENFYERKLLVPNNPDDPRVHVFSANGNQWKRLRTISNPTFTNANLKKLHVTIENSVLELMTFIDANSKAPINFLEYYQEFTMDVIGRIAMGQTESKMFNNPMVKTIANRVTLDTVILLLVGVILPECIAKHLGMSFALKYGPKDHPVRKIVDSCEKAVYDRIAQREKDLAVGIEPGEPADFIDLFLDARSDELFDEAEFSRENIKVTKQLTTDEIIAQCILFLIAGFDTTSVALSYTTHLLATHPEVLKKVQEEIARECPNPSIDFDSLTRMTYLEAVLKETHRLYPLASIVNARKCVNTTDVAGIHVEKGTFVAIDTWTLHHDKTLWGENADEFVPERWIDGEVNKNYWIPFGHGPRQCIGMRLAMMEEKLLLAHLLRKYDVLMGPKSEKELTLIGNFTTQPEAVHLYLKERTDY